MKLSKYESIIFDCDGVITDTNALKTSALVKTLEDYSDEEIQSFIIYHQANGGVSRYEKFKFFIKHILNQVDQSDSIYQSLLDRYSKEVVKVYGLANLTEGCEKFLMLMRNEKKGLYIASGSDEEELRLAFKNKRLADYFEGIYGSPKTKEQCIYTIIGNKQPANYLMIGDSIADLKAARKYRIDFVYMSQYSEQPQELIEECKKGAVRIIDTLQDLLLS